MADALCTALCQEVEELKGQGVVPTLGILRVGERDDDLAYERGACKRCETNGVEVKKFLLPADVSQEDLMETIARINEDAGVHGILMLRPLPKHLDETKACLAIAPEKDVDGVLYNINEDFAVEIESSYPPCTPQACLEILKYYGIDLEDKKVVVLGCGTVGHCLIKLAQGRGIKTLVGISTSPWKLNRAMELGADIVINNKEKKAYDEHVRELPLDEIYKDIDVLIAVSGRKGLVGPEYLNENLTIIDVGIHADEEGKLSGDVDFAGVEPLVKAITPVPGGVGSVTTTVLVSHVVEAARKSLRIQP